MLPRIGVPDELTRNDDLVYKQTGAKHHTGSVAPSKNSTVTVRLQLKSQSVFSRIVFRAPSTLFSLMLSLIRSSTTL